MIQGSKHLVASASALAAAALLSACTGTSGSASASAGAGAAAAGLSQHVNVGGADVRKIALGNDAMLLWRPMAPGATPNTTPGIVNAWVSLSAPVNGVPCGNCVGNPPNPNALGIAFPTPVMALGSSAEETYTFQDVSVTETCTLKFQFKQNGATLATYLFHNISLGLGEFVFFHAGPLPGGAVAGAATVSGDMVCPGQTIKPAVETIYFQ